MWLSRANGVKCEGAGGRGGGKTIESLQGRFLKDFFLALWQTDGVGSNVNTGKQSGNKVLQEPRWKVMLAGPRQVAVLVEISG